MSTHSVARAARSSWLVSVIAAFGAAGFWAEDAAAQQTPGQRLIDSAQNQNQESMAVAISNLCPQMAVLNAAQQLSNDEQQLFFRCRELLNATTTEVQPGGLQALTGEELNAAHSTTVDFGASQYANVISRLAVLRSARGGTVASLGNPAGTFSFGGSSGDADSPLGGGRLGGFLNVRLGSGDRDTTDFEEGYDIDTAGLNVGIDYRFSDSLVGGVAFGYGESEADYTNGGSFDSDGYTASIYGSWYGERAYLDLIGTFGTADHESVREVQYTLEYVLAPNPPVTQTINERALGSTDSDLTGFGASAGYRFGKGALGFGPFAAVSYTRIDTDGFAEQGAGELNLVYGDIEGKSLQLQAGFDVDYTSSRSWGIVSPYARVVFVSEQENDQDAFFVRYALDPCFETQRCQGPNGNPEMTTLDVTSDEPDTSFVQWGIGLSAVFANGVAAFIDYESIAGLDDVSYGELTLGVRVEVR